MERQFTFKDFSLFSFLTLLLVVILLAMYMIDRQWTKMAEMQRTLTEQASDMRNTQGLIRSIEQSLQKLTMAPVDTRRVVQSDTAEEESPPAFARALQASQQADYSEGDWRVSAFSVGLKTITPFISSDAYAGDVQSYVLESLITRNPDTLKWEGLLAKSWQVSEDGLTFTFQLRKNIRFSDGQPLTAEDVAFSFDFIMNPDIDAPRERAFYDKMASVTATNAHEVVFVFKEPYFNSLSLAGGLTILSKHFYQPYLKTPSKFNESKGLLLGTGPYRLKDPKSWTPDSGFVELERNPRYWGPVAPSYNRLLWKIIANDSARLTTYRNGEIDAYTARPTEYQRLLKDSDLMARSQNLEYMSPVAGYSYIGWNQHRDGKATRFADKRVRQAMTYLTDRQRIINDIYLGYAEPAISPFSSRSKQHNPSLMPRSFDLEKAKQLLAEAGYLDRNNDGILEDPTGNNFEFELIYFQDNEDTKRTVLFLKDLYGRAGVLLKPKPMEWAVMLDDIKKQHFDAITLGWTSGVEIDVYQMFHSSQTNVGGDNFVNYKNPAFDTLVDEARATVQEKQRMPLWQQVEQRFYEDQPYTFLMRRQSLVFIDNRIKNIQLTKLGLNYGTVPLETYVPISLQKYQQ